MTATAVLFSGGIDSAVLLALELRDRSEVWPVHMRAGLAWEDAEARAIATLLEKPPFSSARSHGSGGIAPLQALSTLSVEMRDIYPPTHWAVEGRPPAFDTPDRDVYLEGRNVILLAKAAVFCAKHGLNRIAIGPLAGNPFPDATAAFFTATERSLSLGLGRPMTIAAPLSAMHKEDVIALAGELGVSLEFTLSCMNPQRVTERSAESPPDLHCGQCSKCRERRDAFKDARVEDPTAYATTPVR